MSQINYSAPLKSVRTVRAAKIEQCNPSKISADDLFDNGEPASGSDADLISRAGVAFVWENAPGHSKLEQDKAPPLQLKTPRQQALAISSSGKEEDKSPRPAGILAVDTTFNHPISPLAGSVAVKREINSLAKHHLPPKPAQRKGSSMTLGTRLYRNGEYTHQSVAGRQETLITKEQHYDPTPASTLCGLTGQDQAYPGATEERASQSTSEERASQPSRNDRPSYETSQIHAPRRPPNRQHQRDLGERLCQGSLQECKNSNVSQNSCSAVEAGSNEGREGDPTDAGDILSQLNARDRAAHVRFQVSVLDAEQHDSRRHTDPRARDFIMARFLPAAKAMTEERHSADMVSSLERSSLSPTGGMGRSSLPGRSRLAFKDRYCQEDAEQQSDIDQSDILFKSKWQMGALTGNGSQACEPSSVEQSPALSFGNTATSWPELYGDGQLDIAGNFGQKVENSRSFEERALPPDSRSKNRSDAGNAEPWRSAEIDSYGRVLSFSEEAASGGCLDVEYSSTSNDDSATVSVPVPTDRPSYEATAHREPNSEMSVTPTKEAPDIELSGNLGTLLKTIEQPREGRGRLFRAATEPRPEGIPPSSILNHHWIQPTHEAAKPRVNGSPSSIPIPTYSNNVHVESNYPKHHVSRQAPEPAGGSGRSLESINDEVWEASLVEPSPGAKFPAAGNDGTAIISSRLNSPQDTGATGWPLKKACSAYARTPSSDSKDGSFSSFSDHSVRSRSNPGSSSSQSFGKFSPVSVLPPPLPKSPSESWLSKVRQTASPTLGGNWRANGRGSNSKKHLEHSFTSDSMDVKWEVLVKSENAPLDVQEVVRKGLGLEKSEILGSNAR